MSHQDKVVVNGRCLSHRLTGVERYSQEILHHLPGVVRTIRPLHRSQGVEGHIWEQFLLPTRLRPGEILWSPANTGPLLIAHHILTLHDLSWLEHPEWFVPTFALWYRCLLPGLVRRVERLVVPSEFVRQKVLRCFPVPPSRVAVVPGGVDRMRFHPHRLQPGRLPARYVLFTGSLQPRKNLGVLLHAWEQILPEYPDTWLLIAGATSRNFRQVARSTQIERLHFLGYVPDVELPELYAGALAFLLPSLDEGFGLSVLEAMACGTPVIVSNAGSLPEVVGDAGLFFEPSSPSELVHALQRCLDDPDLRSWLAEKGLARARAFSWQSSAGRMWEILQKCP